VDAYEALNVDAKIGDSGQTEEDVQAKMRKEAGKVFSEEKADLPVTTLTVDFLMLGDTEEYAQYKGLERLNLYDTVEIIHSDIGLRTSAQVKSYKWDALHKRYTQITLGDAFEPPTHTVYGYSVADGALGVEKLTPEAIEAIRNG
jgi:phage minor structural protein